MKKSNKTIQGLTDGSNLVIAAMISVPMLLQPIALSAQDDSLKSKITVSKATSNLPIVSLRAKAAEATLTCNEIVGIDNGHIIYKNSKGQYFYLDPKTGNIIYVSDKDFGKFTNYTRTTGKLIKMQKFVPAKVTCDGASNPNDKYSVTIIGIDENGNIIQKNCRGEKFYLDPMTGDFIYVNIK